MPKKQKADIEQVTPAESPATSAPAKKRSSPKTKTAAATHKAPAKRTTRSTTKQSAAPAVEPAAQEVTAVAANPAEVVEPAGVEMQVTESVTIEVNGPAETTQYCAPGSPEEREEIARIAYSYWVARNFAPGDPLMDWLHAEEYYRSRRHAMA